MKELEQIALTALVTLAPLAVAAIGVYLRQLITSKTNVQRVTILRELALQAVHTAEELGYSLDISSPEKLEHATASLIAFGAKYGITVTPEEAQRLVLAALTEFRQTEAALFAPLPGDPHVVEVPHADPAAPSPATPTEDVVLSAPLPTFVPPAAPEPTPDATEPPASSLLPEAPEAPSVGV